jgi:hypothetical protein
MLLRKNRAAWSWSVNQSAASLDLGDVKLRVGPKCRGVGLR